MNLIPVLLMMLFAFIFALPSSPPAVKTSRFPPPPPPVECRVTTLSHLEVTSCTDGFKSYRRRPPA